MTLLITINNPSTVSGHGQQHEIIANRHVIKRTVAALPMSVLSISEVLVAYDFLLVFFLDLPLVFVLWRSSKLLVQEQRIPSSLLDESDMLSSCHWHLSSIFGRSAPCL
jgi:hypothetical protein